MNDTDYAFAVARIRYNELSFLTNTELEQLINANDYKDVISRLVDKGWSEPNDIYNYDQMLESELERAWNLILEIAPDIHELDMLIVKNDFHNLKATLKCSVNNDDKAADYVIKPCVVDPEMLIQTVESHNFDDLPEFLIECAKAGYDAIVKLHNGQIADVVIDKSFMETMVDFARKTKKDMLISIAEIVCNTANIKNAYRCIKTGKDRDYMELSLCDIGENLSKQRMIECCEKGESELTDYLKSTDYSGVALAYEESSTAFEKYCDDLVMSKVADAKSMAFGVEPLVAYYIAKETEIKNVRIILSAKKNNLAPEIISKRVRKSYV